MSSDGAPSPKRRTPFRPDPELVGSYYGDKKSIARRREIVRKALEEAIAADRAAGRIPPEDHPETD